MNGAWRYRLCTLQMTIYQFEVPVFLRKTGTSKTYTAYEFHFISENTKSGEKLVVTMTPNQAKSLLVMLDKAVMKYEAT